MTPMIERRRRRLARSADGAKRSLDERLRPRQADPALLGLVSVPVNERLHVALGVDEAQRLDGRALGLVQIRGRNEAARDHRIAQQRVLRDRKAMAGAEAGSCTAPTSSSAKS